MATAKKETKKDTPEESDVLTIPEQDEEARLRILARSPGGTGTATGVAQQHFSGEEDARIENLEDRGSTVPIAGGSPSADFAAGEPSQPVGAQAQPAHYTVNGTIDPMMVATPGGPQPVGALAGTVSAAQGRVDETAEAFKMQNRGFRGYEALDDAQIERLNGAELRAIAYDRGYDVPEGGNRTVRMRFRAEQADDSRLSGDSAVLQDKSAGSASSSQSTEGSASRKASNSQAAAATQATAAK